MFNEDSRVKIPALVHLTRLGYNYISRPDVRAQADPETNILKDNSEIKLIDFDNFNNNVFHVTTELTCKNGEDEFRPDVAIFVNGIPLGFVEVKKPNNREGIKAERDRMNKRLANRKFRRFFNEFQLYMFSNNMETKTAT